MTVTFPVAGPSPDRQAMNQVAKLCEIYRSSDQIDLVLGAGVSKSSGVPLYLEMALMLAEEASEAGLMPDAPPGAVEYLKDQLELFLSVARDPEDALYIVCFRRNLWILTFVRE